MFNGFNRARPGHMDLNGTVRRRRAGRVQGKLEAWSLRTPKPSMMGWHAGVKLAAVKAPGFGDNRKNNLQDIAALTGGTVRAFARLLPPPAQLSLTSSLVT